MSANGKTLGLVIPQVDDVEILEPYDLHPVPADTKLLTPPEIDSNDLEMLGRVTPLYEQLADATRPLDRLVAFEGLASTYFKIASQFTGKAWQFMLMIEQQGLWKLVKDAEGNQQWRTFYDYVGHFMEGIRSMRRRTIASRVTMAKILMLELGMNPEEAGALLDDKPSITEKAMEIIDHDEFTGEFKGIKPEMRDSLMAELGVQGALPDDKTALREYFEQLAAGEHQEASAMVHRVQDAISVWMTYDARTHELTLHGQGRKDRGPGETSLFEYVWVPKHKQPRFVERARHFLLTRFRPEFRT